MKYIFQNENQLKNIKIDNPTISVIINCYNKSIKKIQETVLSVSNQTYTNLEIILLINKTDRELNKWIKKDSRIKIIKDKKIYLKEVIKKINKQVDFITIINAGEYLEKTYIETNIVSLQLKEDYMISYTDTINISKEKTYNYIFENKILKDKNTPVPNLVLRKEVFNVIKDLKINDLRTWELFADLISIYKMIHQSYYGFYISINITDLTKDNTPIIERKIYNGDIANYPYDDYYYEIIKSNINKLKVFKKPKTKKNILMIIPWMVIGGADMFNLDFLRLIDKDKYEVSVLTNQPKEYVLRQEFEKYTESVMEMSSFIDRKDWPTFIEYMIKTRNIDLILISNSIAGYNMIPYIKLKYPRIPIIDYIHSVELYNRNGGYGRDNIMMKSLIDKTLFCSKNAEESYHNRFDTTDTKTNTVYIGVDSEKFKPSESLRQKTRTKYKVDNTINIGFICRMDYPKRPLLLAEIIKKSVKVNTNTKFIIGGEGPLLAPLKKKIKEYKLNDKVLFLGKITDTVSFYSMCDMTLNCSIKEGLALTAYESLSMGLPIVSADVGGHKELINNKCGVIVPLLQTEDEINNYDYKDEEVDNYVEGINKVISNIDTYKNNSRKRIEEKFSLNKMIIKMQKEIDKAIKKSARLKNSKQLKNNENIVYEYTNNYFMGSQYEYGTLINKYYDYFKKEDTFNKLNESEEYHLFKDYVKSIIKVIVFPFRLIYIEIKKIKKN